MKKKHGKQKKVQCPQCPLKIGPSEMPGHRAWHGRMLPSMPEKIESPQEISSIDLSYKRGYTDGQIEQRRRTGDARIMIVESVAKLNQALAGVLDEFRNG